MMPLPRSQLEGSRDPHTVTGNLYFAFFMANKAPTFMANKAPTDLSILL
jgi:hypothetical protein